MSFIKALSDSVFHPGALALAARCALSCSSNAVMTSGDASDEDGSSEASTADSSDSFSPPDASAGETSTLPVSCAGAAPSLANDVFPILKRSCSGELCHGGTALGAFGGAQGVHAQLVNVQATRDTCGAGVLVSPGSLEKSYLIKKLTGVGICPSTAQMPRNGSPLPMAEIQTIADWICTGAPNN